VDDFSKVAICATLVWTLERAGSSQVVLYNRLIASIIGLLDLAHVGLQLVEPVCTVLLARGAYARHPDVTYCRYRWRLSSLFSCYLFVALVGRKTGVGIRALVTSCEIS